MRVADTSLMLTSPNIDSATLYLGIRDDSHEPMYEGNHVDEDG